jgi:hypothetical protein
LRCLANAQRPEVEYSLASHRLVQQSRSYTLKYTIWNNPTLIDDYGKLTENMTIIIPSSFAMGIIEKIHACSEPYTISSDDEVSEIAGRFVAACLIKMYSHTGVCQSSPAVG